MVSLDDLKINNLNLPVIGTISVAGIIIFGAVIFLISRRKKKVTLSL